MKLLYIGNGFLHGVPARDLSEEEVKTHDVEKLIASGLYVQEQPMSKLELELEPELEESDIKPLEDTDGN